MRPKLGLFALIVGGLLLSASTASAQRNSGSLRGVISDGANGETIAGATVVVTGPALQGAQTFITEADGQYTITNLPPGTYLVTVYYLEVETRRPNALVQLGKTAVVNIKINASAESGEVIVVAGRAPIIDQGSTKTGQTITPDYTENIPTGRTFGGVLGAAAGSQGDIYGVSFGGSTSAENTYIVEGINTTDPAFGLQSTNLPNEFIRETELITGGYNAEYGRSTGAVVNVLTKAGGNEFHGSVFTYFTPGTLTATPLVTPSATSSIELNQVLDYTWSLGAELGGPIVKDKLWFHAGFNPTFSQNNLHRILNRQFDSGDGSPVTDANGFTVVEEVDRWSTTTGGRGFGNLRDTFFTLKLSGAISPDHQGSVSFLGNPRQTRGYSTLIGTPEAGRQFNDGGAWDVSFKWTSKFFNNKTQVDAVAGYHFNERKTILPDDSDLASTPLIRNDSVRNLDEGDVMDVDGNPIPGFRLYGYENIENQFYNGIPTQCRMASADSFVPCPVRFYNIAGHGYNSREETDRTSALLSVTQRVKLLGQHTFKAGLDMELQGYTKRNQFSGGARFRDLGGFWRSDRYFGPDGMGGRQYLENGLDAISQTRNFGGYLQDSWTILPNLTVNAGLRYEQQTLLISDQLKAQGQACRESAMSDGQRLLCGDDEAFAIGNMFAPRLGIIYDPTQEGRAKINAHWGRFYESIPMDINARAFGGEIFNVRLFFDCDDPTPGSPNCNDEPTLADGSPNPNVPVDLYFGGGEEGVVPGVKGQYMDEWVLGGEYELLNDFKVGASYIHRNLGRAIEDVSTDGANTYVIANPGEVDAGAVDAYIDERQVLVTEGLLTQEELDQEKAMLLAAGDFDKPVRRYDALQLTAQKRVSKNLMFIANYTYSKTFGNFPGLFSPETGQLDPNLTSMYDLPELMANRTGILAADRPHLFKLDGYYQADLKKAGIFGVGASIRATSGIPHNVLGSHPLYGFGESYILPRGIWQRSPLFTSFDLQLQYGRRLNKNVRLSAFVRVFNMFNQQPPTDIQELYTLDDVNPCVGCDLNDLPHVKSLDSTSGGDTSRALVIDPNFGNTTQRQAPRSVTLGARLTF